MSALAIDVAGINKHFGDKHVVKDLSLQVRAGEIYGFLGPNGSGKTTSIRMLCGLLTPDSGQGTCLGLDVIRDSAAIKRQVGYMTQRFSLWDDLTIGENLDFVGRMFGMTQRRQAVDQALVELGLEGRRHQLAGTLSGGWKQRLALASCLLHRPKLLLLDEPTAGVDPKARRDFWEEIHRLSAAGITVLVSTHYMDEAERCHRLAYIAYGTLLAAGTRPGGGGGAGAVHLGNRRGGQPGPGRGLAWPGGSRAGGELRCHPARQRPGRRPPAGWPGVLLRCPRVGPAGGTPLPGGCLHPPDAGQPRPLRRITP